MTDLSTRIRRRDLRNGAPAGRSWAWRSTSERLLYGVLAVLAVLGLVSPGQFNVAPADMLVEVAFLSSAALAARKPTTLCVPSQNGLRAERPQRHRATVP